MKLLLPFLFAVSLLTTLAHAQSLSGILSGTVTDPSGAAIPGATISVRNTATQAIRTAETNAGGDFTFPTLEPGVYNLSATANGFKTLERTGINVSASERLPVGTLILAIGDQAERITVEARGAVVQTASSERSAVITSAQVDNLAIRGRSVTSLLGLLPGVVELANPEAPAGTSNFSVLGGRANTNNVMLDGVGVSLPGGAPNLSLTVSMDAVSEVKVQLSNFQAEFGRTSGANVQIVSKSGTKEFHGGGSYFKRHEQFNANNFFNNRNGLNRPRYRYNTWTYNIGGPVLIPKLFNRNRDKLFFFWNWEHWPQKNASAVRTSAMPSAAERAGDFSQSLDVNGARIDVRDPLNGQLFPGNVIPASRLDANGQALLKIFPQPNFFDVNISRRAFNYVTQWEEENPLTFGTLKLDYNLGSKGTLSGTYSQQSNGGRFANGAAGGINTPFAAVMTDRSSLNRLVGIRYNHIFSPTLINELSVGGVKSGARFVMTEDELRKVQRATYGFNAGQFSDAGNSLGLMPGMSFGGITGAAGMNYDGRFPLNNGRSNIDITNNLSKIFRSHTIKAGLFFQRLGQNDGPWANNFNGNFDFGRNVNNPLDSNHPYANAVLGNFNAYSEATSRPTPNIFSRGLEFFAQDTWKANRRLTLDFGIRFHYFEPFWQPDDRLAGFDPGRFDGASQVQLLRPALVNGRRVAQHPITGQVFPVTLIGAVAPNSGNPVNGIVIASEDKSYPRALIEPSGIITAPRVGFAYDPFGDGKTAIRAGFGLFYSRYLGYAFSAANAYPIVQTPVVQFGSISSFRGAQGALFPTGSIAWERNMKVPYVMNMSFGVQRDIGFGTVVDVSYVGALGRHLSWERSLQDIPVGTRFLPSNADPTNTRVPLPDNFIRPLTGYADIGYREGAASSNYHSLQVTGNRRFARGFEFGLAYTWSKALDFVDGDNGRIATVVNPRTWNYGLAAFDRTHILKLNWLWNLPTHAYKSAPVRLALNGWQLSGISTFASGEPQGIGFSQVIAADITGTPSIAPRIDVLSSPYLPPGERTFSRNFRTDVFRLPARGTTGNAAKTLVRGPGISNWDISAIKTFPIRERVSFQFRAEFYNAFNHTQFSAFDTTARFDSSGNQVNARLGEFTAARNPRIVQLALRLRF